MSRIFPMIGLLPFLVLTGCAQKSEVDALKEQVTKLEERVAAAEKRGPAGATTADPEAEAAATKLMEEIQLALKDNDNTTAKSKLAELTGKYGATKAGKAAGRMAAEINLVGSDAKPIEAQKWYTKQGSLDDSKVTMVVFWELWCPHCKKELPTLPAKLDKFKSKGFGIVAMTKVTKSATDEGVEAFIKEHKLEGIPVGKEPEGGTLSQAYAVSGIPAAALVKDGKVIWRGHPARLTDEMLDGFLAG